MIHLKNENKDHKYSCWCVKLKKFYDYMNMYILELLYRVKQR